MECVWGVEIDMHDANAGLFLNLRPGLGFSLEFLLEGHSSVHGG
jgi:hypothetical protein